MPTLNKLGMYFPLPEYQYNQDEFYVIYGTGEVAYSYYNSLVKIIGEDNILFFLSSSSDKQSFCNKKVVLINKLKLEEKTKSKVKFILASYTSSLSMEQELLKKKVSKKQIIQAGFYTFDSFVSKIRKADKILIYPSIGDEKDFKMLYSKIKYFVPELEKSNTEFYFLFNKMMSFHEKNVQLISELDNLKVYDIVLIWNKNNLNDIKPDSHKMIYCIDPSFFQFIDVKILVYLNYFISASCIKENENISLHNYKQLTKLCADEKKAFIFGTGPSLTEGIEKSMELINENSLKIVCNGGINSVRLMEEIKPNLYVLSDIEILMENLRQQMDKIAAYVASHICYIALCRWWLPLVAARYPALKDRMIGINETAREICIPSADRLQVYAKAHNVITRLAVPLASAFCDVIYITGCDGVDLTEKKDMNFQHGEGIEERHQNVQQYEYFVQHYQYFEDLLTFGRRKCKTYISLTSSYIPALNNRTGYEKESWANENRVAGRE